MSFPKGISLKVKVIVQLTNYDFAVQNVSQYATGTLPLTFENTDTLENQWKWINLSNIYLIVLQI